MLPTNGLQVYRIENPLSDESPKALYIILDHSNPDNLLVQCINAGNNFINPTQSGFKLSELKRVHADEIADYPDNFLKS